MSTPGEIDPHVQAAADKLRKAYSRLEASQDPLVKDVDRQAVLNELNNAVIVTEAAELKHLIKDPIKPNSN
jgi:L-lysine 2,3-aminomutase